jgi:hypothetical protein
MQATVGQRLVIRAHHAGEPIRDAKIVEVRGPDGGPPYMVEWSDDGRVGLVYPGPDAYIDHDDEGHQSSVGT